jgi:hypothetical protein
MPRKSAIGARIIGILADESNTKRTGATNRETVAKGRLAQGWLLP